MSEHFDRQEYLGRVGLGEPPSPDEEGLEALHRAQIYSIPFENLDIHLGRGVDVTPGAVYRKLVQSRRGGYCFELNGLFLQALLEFGFEARPLLARVHLSGDPGGRTHQLTLVNIHDREWIADVGFGSTSLRGPIPLQTGLEHEQDGQTFRLTSAPPFGTMLQLRGEEGWQNLYTFDMEHVCHADIEVGNHYTSTSPNVFFTRMRVANLPNPRGRISLSDMTLTEVRDGVETRSEMPDGEAYIERLEALFGIGIGARFKDFSAPGLS